MTLIGDLLDAVYPFALSFLGNMGDKAIDGTTLNADQKRSVYNAYIELKLWAVKIAASTENPYDDATVLEAISLAEDTLTEAGLPIPLIPKFVDSDEPET